MSPPITKLTSDSFRAVTFVVQLVHNEAILSMQGIPDFVGEYPPYIYPIGLMKPKNKNDSSPRKNSNHPQSSYFKIRLRFHEGVISEVTYVAYNHLIEALSEFCIY